MKKILEAEAKKFLLEYESQVMRIDKAHPKESSREINSRLAEFSELREQGIKRLITEFGE